jgi:hypothetical protein
MALKTNSPGERAAQLLDPFGRKIEYLRLSVTDKCNEFTGKREQVVRFMSMTGG